MTRNQKIIFAIILAVAAFLIFFRLGRQDLLSDDGHYAFRALGYYDYMASEEQTTPLQWFGERPWWSFLSFHDHPPVYFLVQHFFFKLFGASVVVSRLTSAFAALGSTVLIFLLGRRFGGARFGLLAMAGLALNNYFIWTGRIGLIESLFVFWLLLGLLYLWKALRDNPKYFLWAGFIFGLTLLTKYTLLFFAPAILGYLVWRERRVFAMKQFWLGAAIFLLTISPLVIYNLNMHRTRGHFDVQFSDLFGQQHSDWTILTSRIGETNYHPAETLKNFAAGTNYAYLALVLTGIGIAIRMMWKENATWPLFMIAMLFVALVFFSYVGGATRWLGVLSPFAALLAAMAGQFIFQRRFARWILPVFVFNFLIVIFNANHTLAAPQNPWIVSSLRVENEGYNQLDEAITKLVSGNTVPLATRDVVKNFWFGGIKAEELPLMRQRRGKGTFNSLIIYDANTRWFPVVWTFGRFRTYYGVPAMDSSEFGLVVRDENARAALDSLGFDRIYYIHGSEEVNRLSAQSHPESAIILEGYKKQGRVPEVIRDLAGREAFYIY